MNLIFVYPNFLWALTLLSIPIIVHLFNFRRYKTVYFSRVKFLKEVTEDSKSGSRLKHLLVLLSRLLAMASIIFAFAQPFIPAAEGTATENITSIYLDNSYSMQAEGQDGNLLNEAKNKAIELVKSLDNNEKVNLLTGDLLSTHQRFYSKDEVISMIKEIDFSAKSTPLKQIIGLQIDLLSANAEQGNKRIFLFSDFQQSTSSFEELPSEEVSTFFYQTNAQQKGNIFIDSVWFETPVHRANTPVDVYFRVQNSPDQLVNDLSVGLRINDTDPAPKRISIPANSYTEDKISFTDRTAGTKRGEISVTTSQLFFDDVFYFTYDIKEFVEILIVKSPEDKNRNLEQLYVLDDYYKASSVTVDQLTQEDMKDKELIIFQNINRIPDGIMDLCDEALKGGASVVLIPGKDLDFANWNSYLSKRNLPSFSHLDSVNISLNYFNSEDPLYTGVFESTPKNYQAPMVFNRYFYQLTSSQNFMTLFGANQNDPFMVYSKAFNGRIILLGSSMDPSYTNFQNHALFAATFLRFAETSSFQKPLYMTIGEEDNYPLNQKVSEKNPIHIVNEEFGTDAIPQIINTNSARFISFSHLENTIKLAGFYELTDNTSESNSEIQGFNSTIALNYNRAESWINIFDETSLIGQFEKAGWTKIEKLNTSDGGQIEINQLKASEYWRILLILALIFIAIEILLLKLWRT
ncbi:MAG: BatA and WFA domain-containing protein [Flavobacteriales bacterium]|nr:BatA and WFA domain-containing protein [Flavobacteriales bacterium]